MIEKMHCVSVKKGERISKVREPRELDKLSNGYGLFFRPLQLPDTVLRERERNNAHAHYGCNCPRAAGQQ